MTAFPTTTIKVTTMSVTRALAEIKRLKDRIAKSTNNTFVAVSIGTGAAQKMHGTNETVAQVSTTIQSSIDSSIGLIARYNQLKCKVVQSNAVTRFTVGGMEVSVAEAIERKTSLPMYKALLSAMQMQLSTANGLVEALNSRLDSQIETNLTTVYGAAERSKIDASLYEAVAKPQRDLKQASLLDPKLIRAEITKLDEYISLVESELDFTLSEVNAKTEIQV